MENRSGSYPATQLIGDRRVPATASPLRDPVAKVLGFDATTDIAVLRIAASGLPTVRLGDANSLMVGDPVLAIGAPFGRPAYPARDCA